MKYIVVPLAIIIAILVVFLVIKKSKSNKIKRKEQAQMRQQMMDECLAKFRNNKHIVQFVTASAETLVEEIDKQATAYNGDRNVTTFTSSGYVNVTPDKLYLPGGVLQYSQKGLPNVDDELELQALAQVSVGMLIGKTEALLKQKPYVKSYEVYNVNQMLLIVESPVKCYEIKAVVTHNLHVNKEEW